VTVAEENRDRHRARCRRGASIREQLKTTNKVLALGSTEDQGVDAFGDLSHGHNSYLFDTAAAPESEM
jgi:hypothetical protein